MAATVLYSENVYPDDSVERRIYGPDVRLIFPKATESSRVRSLRGIWVSGGEAEGLHSVGVLSFGDEFRDDGALGGIQEKFGEAVA